MLKNKRLLRFAVAAGIPLLFLLGLTAGPLMTWFTGTEVVLETRPVDPRDVFRGDHVVLDYAIAEIPAAKIPKSLAKAIYEGAAQQKSIYVLLKPERDVWGIAGVSLEKPSKGVYLKARFQYLDTNGEWDSAQELPPLSKMVVSYNLDRYFVPENTGKRLEELARTGRLAATIRVRDGNGLVVKVQEYLKK